MATFNSAGSGNANADATWTESGQPAAGDHCIIASGHTVTLTATEAWGSVAIASGGTLAGGGYTLTLNDGGQATIFQNLGTISGNLDVTITGGTSRAINDASTGDIRTLTINNGSSTFTQSYHLTVTTLTITAGTLNTGADKNLTVAGVTTLGVGSGSADVATLTCNASAVSLGASETSSYGLIVDQGGTFVGGSGAHTIGSFQVVNYATAKCTLTSGVTTLSSERTGDNRAITIGGTNSGFDDGNGTVTITFAGATTILTSAKPLYNVIVNHASANIDLADALTVANNLTITAGTLDTTGSNYALTVTGGRISVSGTLLLNNSTVLLSDTGSDLYCSNSGTITCGDANLTVNAVSIGQGAFTAPSASGSFIITGEKSGLAFDYDGNQFIHNSGTIDIRTQDTTLVDFTPNDAAHIDINNVIINHASCIATLPSAGGIGGALTITAGKFDCAGYDLSVGSVTIADGAEFRASSGTTTITSHASNWTLKNEETDGTGYVHNNGTLAIETNASGLRIDQGGSKLNNLKIGKASGADDCWVQYQTGLVILGNLDLLYHANFSSYSNGNTLTVHGITNIGASAILGNTSTSGAFTYYGLITNNGTFRTGSGTNNLNGGVRNLGTFTSDDTLTIGGTGGILEGNLDDAIINVNLDPALSFDGVNDYVKIAGHADLDFGTGDFTVSGWVKGWVTGGAAMYLFDMRESGNTEEPAVYFSSPNVIYYANSGSIISTALTCSADDWNHIAIARISGTTKLYINGVEKGSASDGTDYDSSGNTIGVNLGRRYNNTSLLNGNIADFRIYKGEGLSAANIQVLASKINGDSSLGAGTTNLKVWLKVNEGTGTAIDNAQGTSATDGVAVNSPTWVFDRYSVNVQDNTTTTDGTVTVTQGKLEGLSLSSHDFDGSADYITVADAAGLSFGNGSTDTPFTMSAWVRMDDATRFEMMTKGIANTQFEWMFFTNGGDDLSLLLADESVTDCWTGQQTTATVTSYENQWVHFAATYSGDETDTNNGIALYINGVQVATENNHSNESSYVAMENGTAAVHIGRYDSHYANGEMRDVRIYDYDLSADQMASLYSGSYNVTPKYWWKIDEGSGATAAIEDYGTGTDADGTGVSLGAWTNGTLDLDSTLTIAANGTLSAPRGTMSLAGTTAAFDNSGTFTHNNGTVKFDNGADVSQKINDSGSVEPVFYNLTNHRAANSYHTTIEENITVENNFTNTAGYINLKATKKITLGTDTSQGTYTAGWASGGIRPSGTSDTTVYIYGKNQLYPAIMAAGSGEPIDWNNEAPNTQVNIKWLDYQTAATTGGSGTLVTLDGDCEFDAVTVSSGDTLDLNGQRMEMSGTLDIDGTMDMDGLLLTPLIDDDGSTSNHASSDIIFTSNGALDLSGNVHRTLFFNGSGDYTPNNTGMLKATNCIIGSNTLELNDVAQSCTNLTIATGGTLQPEGSTVTVAGDFTTSGGLIGKSAATFDGTGDYISAADHSSLNITGALTVEAWVKTSSSSSMRIINKDDGSNRDYFLMSLDGSRGYRFGIFNSNTEYQVTSGADTAYADGKWHHVAGVFTPSTSLEIYVDGKLEAINTSSIPSAIDNDTEPLWIGAMGDGSAYWNGNIARVSVWSEALTQAKIRAMLFQDWTTMAADATHTDSNAELWWEFNEGTGTVSDSSSNSNTGTFTNATWAGAGTFTYGTSTLSMTGTSKNMNLFGGDTDIYNLDIQGTITNVNYGANNNFKVQNNLTVGTNKTLTSSGQIKLYNSGATFTFATPATNVVNVTSFSTRESGTFTIPEVTMNKMFLDTSGSNVVASGNHTYNQELEVNSGTTFNANGNTITCSFLDVGGGTVDLRNSTYLGSTAGTDNRFDFYHDGTLLTGNTTVTGTAARTNAYFRPIHDFEIVGDVSNLYLRSDGDLTVIGSVTNCTVEGTGDIIRQWHHTLDTQQLLDADSAGDDDLRLTKPALDNSHELMTG